MARKIVKEFEHNGHQCIIEEDKRGFWGRVLKDGEIVLENLFPEETIEDEIHDLTHSIDLIDKDEPENDMNCHLCGGCSECGAYCTTECTCYDEPYDMDDMDNNLDD